MSETAKKKYPPRYRGHSRLLKSGNGGNLSVPSEMMSVLEGSGNPHGLLFKPELTKDGILFRIVDEDKLVADEKVIPAWVKKVTGPVRTTGTGDPEPPLDSTDNDPGTDDAIVGEEEDAPPVTDDESPF